jgi:ParB/RepB/Spo0J family partition protein
MMIEETGPASGGNRFMAKESKKRNRGRVREGACETELGHGVHINTKSPKIVKIAIADIQVVSEHRELNLAVVRVIAESMLVIGLKTPITVRRIEKIRDGVSTAAIELLAGRHRLEAASSLGWTHIDAFVMEGDETEARIWQLLENLRADLTALERAEDVAELVELVRDRAKAGQLAHPGGQQPHDRGISHASKTLGFTREEVRRSKAIAGISSEAKAKAKALGLDKNQSALLEIATEDAADGQLAKIEEIEIRNFVTPARLRNRRGASQVKAHKKCKAHTRRSTPKSSASDDTAETATPPAADSPVTVPETVSGDETAAEIERLKAELAEKTERLRQIENELRQARLAASGRFFRSPSRSPSSSSSSSSLGSRGGSTPMIVTRLRSTNQAEMLSGGVMPASRSPTDVSAQGKLGNPGRCGVDLRLVEELGDALV